MAAEIDPTIRSVYATNFPKARVARGGDVRFLFPGQVKARTTSAERRVRKRSGPCDVLLGGPPCQGNSDLNNHTRRMDEKNALYLRMVRAAEILEPTSIAIENVPGVRNDRGRVVDRAVERLCKLGYEVAEGTVAVVDIGVPQLRVRHVLLASACGTPSLQELVSSHRRVRRDVHWAIADLEDVSSDVLFDSAPDLSAANASRVRWMIRERRHDLPNWKRPACHRFQPDHTYKSMYGRLRWDQPAQTITTGFGSPGQGRYVHPSQPRTITPHEAARLQFFPDWFDFSAAKSRVALAHCIGNAVPPKLGFAIARYLVALAAGRRLADQPAAGSPVSSDEPLAAE